MIGVVRLSREFGHDRLRQAVDRALELGSSDVEAIRNGMNSLAETLQRVSTAAYQAAGSASANGTDGADGAGEEPGPEGEGSPEASPEGDAAGEETVEGEFKEV